MTLSIENSLLSPQILIDKCIAFIENRPGLKKRNTEAKLRFLTGREFDELIDSIHKPDPGSDQWIVEVAEELPDVLIFILQHWLFDFRTHTEIAQLLFHAESKASLLPIYTNAFYAGEMKKLQPDLALEQRLDDAICVQALTICFGLSHSLGFDLYELADIKADHNDKRYQPELYTEDCDYDASRNQTRAYAKEMLPKEIHLYPLILQIRRERS